MSHSTYNRSFWRRSSQPNFGLYTEETVSNTTQGSIHQEHKYVIRGSYIAEIYVTYFYSLISYTAQRDGSWIQSP